MERNSWVLWCFQKIRWKCIHWNCRVLLTQSYVRPTTCVGHSIIVHLTWYSFLVTKQWYSFLVTKQLSQTIKQVFSSTQDCLARLKLWIVFMQIRPLSFYVSLVKFYDHGTFLFSQRTFLNTAENKYICENSHEALASTLSGDIIGDKMK